ncbi:Imidazole glycerol phosphate synthase subunit HisH 1 [Magnetospirillum sp. LM-5]|uniref:imidazole glycerol phosphate synthase subunit HisH n=1 Tax=Magnetospirillum sp. LM-5 TaxID=2681466 RepID=UPI001383F070|nr:imidazole glycerol phosphate synthase subunit HisH [Magnetospirillum sp. LM-5]CAA7622598.1 Imidazole glycerol phosphate synthase subunit HisH 1 [Magnetospirillum sp. LM-5]
MTAKVTIVDFGAGNLLSVARAFRHCGATVELAETAEQVTRADRLVLPGVGAFADSMTGVQSRGLVEPLKAYAATGRPFLGVCVGMQMLFDGSEEFGHHPGLGLVPGMVRRIPATGIDGRPVKVPHIGWNQLITDHWGQGLLTGLSDPASVYFVHSFAGQPDDRADILAECAYGGRRVLAAVRRGNLIGCQFHPEKSGETGLTMIRNFLVL